MNKKNFWWNVTGSLTNSFTSLFLMIIVKRVNGLDLAGVFSFAFTFSLLIQVIGYYCGRSYQVTERDESVTASDYFYSRFFTCFVMLVVGLLYLLFKNYSMEKNLIIFLLIIYKTIESFADVLYGIVQRNGKLYQVGISLFLKGIIMVFLFLLVDLLSNNLIFSIISLSIINILFVIFYDYKNVLSCDFKLYKFNKSNFFKILKGGFFVFVFSFLVQYVINSPKYAIDSLLSDKYQFIFGILLMPSTLIGLFSQFFVQPFLNEITSYVKDGEYKSLNKLNIKISFILFLSLFVTSFAAYYFGIPFLNLIYGINLEVYKNSLLIILVGATFFGISYLLSTSLIAMRKNFIQTLLYIIVSIFAYFISIYLVTKFKIFGASLSYLLAMVLLFILYLISYIFYVLKEDGKR